MRFDIITIFPKIFDSYFSHSILARAKEKKMIEIIIHDLREYAKDKRRTVDDTPYGGGAGMILKIEPIFRALNDIERKTQRVKIEKKNRIIIFSAKGKLYTQDDAIRLSQFDSLTLICGRYEGVDERVAKHLADEEISIGKFVLTGGEIPAMILVDSISRLIPNVLGNPNSLGEESFGSEKKEYGDNLEYPQYTKPEKFLNWQTPKILLSGNHQKIKDWRKKHSQKNA